MIEYESTYSQISTAHLFIQNCNVICKFIVSGVKISKWHQTTSSKLFLENDQTRGYNNFKINANMIENYGFI